MGERRGTKALELWCRRMTDGYPGVKIDNMTTSWRDGLAFCAMIHHFRPELIEFEKLNKGDIYYNNDLAFRTAERHLGIPALLDADDMAAYEVPDRLSILTYLSQFYQVFAAQDSPNRLKRPSTTTEKSQITKTQGPPAKMAHVVGVPKRDPCQKCNLPVFLAERLTVGKRVYHRTCLKCARCNYQLTPGSFYETEIDGEYCCETCPDEESSLEVETQAVLRNPPLESYDAETAARPKTTVRSSIADRLAFFEQSKELPGSSKLLQKSLSDEEKTKSLKKMSDETSPSYKMNAALSNFMNSTLDDEVDGEKKDGDISLNSAQMDTSESVVSSSDSDDDGEEDDGDETEQKPPELPTTLPPQPVESKSSTLEREQVPEPFEDHLKTLKPESKKEDEPLIATAQITLMAVENIKADNNTKHEDYSKNESDHDDDAQVEESLSTTSITITTTADDLNLSKSKSNFVTKDNTEPDEQMRTTNATIVVESITLPPPQEERTAAGPAEKVDEELPKQQEVEPKREEVEPKQEEEENEEKNLTESVMEKPPLRQRPITLDIKTNCNSDMTAAHEDEETTNRLSVVRARLHQFEVIANNKNTNDNLMHRTPENSSSVNSNSIKSDSNSVNPLHQDEDEKKIETVSVVQTNSCSAPEPVLILKSDEVPRNDETTEILVEIEKEQEKQKEIETVSIEEINPKQQNDDNVDDATTPTPATIATTSGTNLDIVPESPRKVVAVDIEMDTVEVKQDTKIEEETQQTAMEVEEETPIKKEDESKPFTSPAKINIELYPEELNPFQSDDEDDEIAPLPVVTPVKPVTPAPRRSLNASTPSTGKKEDKDKSLNPFDSSDDEVEMEKKVKPPRPPPPKISKNPFGSESEEGGDENYHSMATLAKKAPVPAPRNVSLSQNPTPEPTPRLSSKLPNHHISPLNNSSDFYGSNSSLGSTPYSLQRNTEIRGSNNSLTSSTGTIRSRKSRKAPAPPPPVKELFPSTETLDSKKSSPSSSNSATPHQGRKKRPAPAPPKPARLLDPAVVLAVKIENNNDTGPKNSLSYPLQSDLDKLSDEEKALLEGNRLDRSSDENQKPEEYSETNNTVRKLVPLDFSLVSDSEDLIKQKEEDHVVYRRIIIPTNIVTPTHDEPVSHDRQLEKMKDNKEAQNRNRQSQVSSGAEDSDPLYNKSSHGKWKRRKGPAPALPIPPRKVLQMLPLQEIRHELDIIEVQQQGLEKQGVILEKMIRDRCEGKNGELDSAVDGNVGTAGHPQNSKEVEDLILQLFELVNEKNELFRRQAELMYLRRQHRLEQEQADLEYEIRVLMAQPERNKTDTDKAREEALIARMVEVVQLRNEVVECLEMDRLREAEEDLSIKQRLELHSAKREQEMNRNTLSKLSKKEKKKQKESKKLGKSKKLDADKDADESELSVEKQKSKKKKKKFLF